jgi:hypothetical protein
VANLLFTGDDVIWVTWKYKEDEDDIPLLPYTNGPYVSNGTRLKLYFYLDALKDRGIYCVTDSVFYILRCGELLALACGDRLGDMATDWGLVNLGKQEQRLNRVRCDVRGDS